MAEIPQKIIFDVITNILRDSSGNEITATRLFPSATLTQKFPVNVQLTKNSDGEKYEDLETNSSAQILVDDDYNNPSPILGLPGDPAEDYWKVDSGSEYYYDGSEIEAKPASVYLDGSIITEGTQGSLAVSEWAWDVGNSRLVVRLADSSDPDTKGNNWVGFKIDITDFTRPFIEVDSSTFNQSNSWYDTDTETFRDPVIEDGELSFDVNANGFDFYDRLENKAAKIDTTMQIQMLAPITANLYEIFEFQFVCKNIYLGSNFELEVIGANVYSKAEIDAFLLGKVDKDLFNLVTSASATISGGVVSLPQSTQTLIPETGATDDLDTVNGMADGELRLIRVDTATDTITLKHGTGNLVLPDDSDFELTGNTEIILHRDGASIRMIGGAGGGGGSLQKFTTSISLDLSTGGPYERNILVFATASSAIDITPPAAADFDNMYVIKVDAGGNAITFKSTVNGVVDPYWSTTFGRLHVFSDGTTLYSGIDITP